MRRIFGLLLILSISFCGGSEVSNNETLISSTTTIVANSTTTSTITTTTTYDPVQINIDNCKDEYKYNEFQDGATSFSFLVKTNSYDVKDIVIEVADYETKSLIDRRSLLLNYNLEDFPKVSDKSAKSFSSIIRGSNINWNTKRINRIIVELVNGSVYYADCIYELKFSSRNTKMIGCNDVFSYEYAQYSAREYLYDLSGDDNFNLIFEKASQEWSGDFYLRESKIELNLKDLRELKENPNRYLNFELFSSYDIGNFIEVEPNKIILEEESFRIHLHRYPDINLVWYGIRTQSGLDKPLCIEIAYVEPGLYKYKGSLPDILVFLTALELNSVSN